ncbi:hypothetical protein DFQ26_003039 [Actinomortierella ambigua]|nr:hypothetical protein DFQ26_003039 [Actinomortierella ambigua]
MTFSNLTKRILDLWFKDFVPGKPIPVELRALWWGKSKETDNMLRDEFGHYCERALSDANFRKEMASTGEGAVALAVLLDQFPRNIHRGTGRPFNEFDPVARLVAKEAIANKTCEEVHHVHRIFLYMPLEHSEAKEDQQESIAQYERLADTCEPCYKEYFDNVLNFAKEHKKVIDRFGRYPGRNVALGRQSTEEELKFLATAPQW